MPFVPVITPSTTAAAAAAARRRRMLENEEERMTTYDKEDLEGWEFKIVRASTRKFRHREVVQQLCEEEARAGWEMVEKFDNQRIRFKRRIEHRADDRHREIDPYRTQIGMDAGRRQVVLTITLAILFLIVALTMFFQSH